MYRHITKAQPPLINEFFTSCRTTFYKLDVTVRLTIIYLCAYSGERSLSVNFELRTKQAKCHQSCGKRLHSHAKTSLAYLMVVFLQLGLRASPTSATLSATFPLFRALNCTVTRAAYSMTVNHVITQAIVLLRTFLARV